MDAKEFLCRLRELAKRKGHSVSATFIVRHCGWYACMGYHPSESIVVYPDGRLEYWPSAVGIHSKIDPPPKPQPITEQEAITLAKRLLLAERKAMRHPFLSYHEVLDPLYE
jgi:hypothetical protein